MISLKHSISNKKREDVYRYIKIESPGGKTYFLLVTLAAIVATLGLLTNSSSVIIGAMLISPIMSPIIAMSFSITLGDSKIFSVAIKEIIFGILLAITVSVFITLFLPSRTLTTEILSRTKPTIIDLIIALASGAAGAYTMCNKKESSVVPGVAIATALMPPLCVVGTGLAQSDYTVAVGGFILFLTNLIAINLASALVFKAFGFTTKDEIYKINDETSTVKTHKRRLFISIMAFVIILIPLSFFMYSTIVEEKNRKLIDDSLNESTRSFDGVDLINYTYKYENNKYLISAVVRSINKLDGSNIKFMENNLEKQLGKPTEIKMKVLLAQEIDALTEVASEKSDESSETNTDTKEEVLSNLNADKTIEYTIKDKLNMEKAKLVDFKFEYSSSSAKYIINIIAEGPDELSNDIKTLIESQLENDFNRKVIANIQFKLENSSISNDNDSLTIDQEMDIYKQ